MTTNASIHYYQEELAKAQKQLETLQKTPEAIDITRPTHNVVIGQINQLKGSIQTYHKIISDLDKPEPYQEEIKEDLDEIDLSVAKAENEYAKAEQEYKQMEKSANEILSESEKFQESDVSELILAVRNEAQQAIREQMDTNVFLNQQNHDLEEQLKSLQNAFDELSHKYSELEFKKEVETLTQKALKSHPFKYAHFQMKQAMENIKQSKASVRIAGGAYKDAKEATDHIAKEKVANAISPMVSAAGNTLVRAAKEAGQIYIEAINKGKDLLHKGAKFLKQCCQKIVKTEDKILDTLTLGAYSKINLKCAQYRENHPEKENIPLFQLSNELSTFFRGEDKVTYWENIQENAFFWGKKEMELTPGQTQTISMRSPVQTMEDGIQHALTDLQEAFYTISSQVQTKASDVKDNVKAFETKTIECLTATGLEIKAGVEDLKSYIYEQLANYYEKHERRAASKISQIYKADHEIFEANNLHRQAIHHLVAITPYEKQDYQTSSEVAQMIEHIKEEIRAIDIEATKALYEPDVLKKQGLYNKLSQVEQTPSVQAAREILKSELDQIHNNINQHADKEKARLGKQLSVLEQRETKSEKAWNKMEQKKVETVGKQIDAQLNEYIDNYNDLMDNRKKLEKNLERKEKAREQLEKATDNRNKWDNFANNTKNKSNDLKQQAIDLRHTYNKADNMSLD